MSGFRPGNTSAGYMERGAALFARRSAGVRDADIPRPDSVVLKLTTGCNLACDYCYVDAGRVSARMPIGLVRSVLEQLDAMDGHTLSVFLHGGEPLLARELLWQICSDVQSGRYTNPIHLMLQSNATLITVGDAELLARYGVSVGISLDGTTDDSNAARPNTSGGSSLGAVMRGVRALIDAGCAPGVMSVLTGQNAGSVRETVRDLYAIGIRQFAWSPVVPWGRASRALQPAPSQVLHAYMDIIEEVASLNRRRVPPGAVTERTITWLARNLTTQSHGYMCQSDPCGAGLRTFSVDTNGDVYICDQFHADSRFRLGNLSSGRLPEILTPAHQGIVARARNLAEIAECHRCRWKYVCCGGCPAAAYYSQGSFLKPSPYCTAYRSLIEFIDRGFRDGSLPPWYLGLEEGENL